ncbi:sensor domain-containing phosphodiesterase [Thalassospira lucentensis]|uniref:sensor domain-containing phosphodiesterase n=1 Tax=Thalassospira lucentensis TaxID=168935 RepID=UPI00142E08B2|nr:EAL domain-containing protein [Thalassospira lucentensis]NIZ02502.1 EAL domain-containing protein [Thalassospira lucentensis]
MTHSSGYSAETNDQDLLAAMAFCWADMLLEVDENGYVLFVAGATESLLGCGPDRLIGEALEKLVLKSERPLLRAYLHAGSGLKRLEELDLDFQLFNPDGTQVQDAVPLSLSGYMVANPTSRYFLAARHRAMRPRARSGIDRLILQSAVQKNKRAPESQSSDKNTDQISAKHQSEALVVLENLAASRSEAETAATNELAHLIGIRTPKTSNFFASTLSALKNPIHPVDEPMIELERRIVAYASALRVDLDDTSTAETTEALLSLTNDVSSGITTKKSAAEPTTDMFGNDYDSARNIHQLDAAAPFSDGENDRETNLTRAVAYALNRMQHRSQNDVSAERLSASLPHLIQETLKSVRAFREIVENGSFAVALQPIVRLGDREMHHFEALARFTNGSNPLAVDQIIHFAEGTGLITEFDLAMSRKVLDHLRDTPSDIPYPVAVNLSGHSLEQSDFLADLMAILDEYDIEPDRVLFEVTETSRIRALKDVNDGLQTLRARGHKICLDDFGAGAANFEYLSALDVDIIKFDGGAMRTALANPKGRAFLKATALLCRDLEIHTIAEMIHDQASYDMVCELGIDYGQGYHLGPPVTIGAKSTNSPTEMASSIANSSQTVSGGRP